MTIGERIKELRKKNDLTQEKLADYLCVSYQAVSKWECGLSCPDFSMIVPLAKLLHVTTDELLGMNEVEASERRAELDEHCDHYWLYDDLENYELAKQAVSEYPMDYKYLHWLASMEYFVAYEDKYRTNPKKPYSIELIDSSIKHNSMVLEGTKDPELRESAIWNIMLAYKCTDRPKEALQYANMFPDKKNITRMKALRECLEEPGKSTARQTVTKGALNDLCMGLMEAYRFATEKTPEVMAALDTEEAVLKTVFPDGNYGSFLWNMYTVYEKRTKLEVRCGDLDTAMEYAKKACLFAKAYDKICNGERVTYTTPVFVHCSGEHITDPMVKSFWETVKEELLTDPQYASLREREDFQALLDT